MPSEFDFISWIRAQSSGGDMLLLPPGDDLAVVKWDANDLLIVGADQVLDGVHFDSAKHSPADIGRKVMNRNLSDCAAMACVPAAAVATVALPRGSSLDYARQLYLGMKAAADLFSFPIVGGDTASWEGKLVLSVTILGRSAGITPVARSGAKPGDGIYVTGPLGGSLLGRHITFRPRVNEAIALATLAHIHAMIDISDGLSRDLAHICEQSRAGAVVRAADVPIHDDARAAMVDGRSALEHALHDGEDHELLFTTPSAIESFRPIAVFPIGHITAEAGIWIEHPDGLRQPLEPKGWEHKF